MKVKVRLLLLWLALIPLGSAAQGITDVVTALRALQPWHGAALVDVTVPGMGAEGQASYAVELFSSQSTRPGCYPLNLLIESSRQAEGDGPLLPVAFTAVVDSVRYNWDGRRLAESVIARADSAGTTAAPVAQFQELLPYFLAERLQQAATDDDARFTVTTSVPGPDRLLVEVTEMYAGEPQARESLLLATPSLHPIEYTRTRLSTIPGMENSLHAIYRAAGGAAEPSVVDRRLVESRHSEVMSRFTRDNLDPSNFVGYAMPPFSLPDLRGGRFNYEPRFNTLLVMVDDEDRDYLLEETVITTRDLLAEHPRGRELDVVYVSLSRFSDAAPASGSTRPHEYLLLDGHKLSDRLGATIFPLALLIDEEGTVVDVDYSDNPADYPAMIKGLLVNLR